MAESEIKNELKAIETITSTLKSFDKTAQQRVLQYAMQHLGLEIGQVYQLKQGLQVNTGLQKEAMGKHGQQQMVDIRSLRNKKQPNSDMEMAAIVAYYLSELTPEENRKDVIATEDIKTYFKQAGHPLPKAPEFTLPNAKGAGYFESAGRGKYRLNPVGHNLVVHGLPRAVSESSQRPRRKKTSKSSQKKAR